MKNHPLRIIPLGGLGEVGENMMVYEYDDQLLVVDAGLMFPENDMLGIDYIIPDISYLTARRNKVKGIVITHGHEDHTGAVRHLLEEIQAPIYSDSVCSKACCHAFSLSVAPVPNQALSKRSPDEGRTWST